MDLQSFLPYRLAVVAEEVSRALAAIYADRFELTREEWRVLVWLAAEPGMTATELGARANLDKMQVSRAIARMEKDGLLEREPDPDDRRSRQVRLLPAGRALFRKVEPMALAREAFLLEALAPHERAALESALSKLGERARQLQRQG
jgi:DNA-binding MarR family transcriptional regulator